MMAIEVKDIALQMANTKRLDIILYFYMIFPKHRLRRQDGDFATSVMPCSIRANRTASMIDIEEFVRQAVNMNQPISTSYFRMMCLEH